MENLSVNCFMDGNDFVVVFKNTKPETADLIRNILGVKEEPEKIIGLKADDPEEDEFSYKKPISCPVCGKQMQLETSPDSRESYRCECGKTISIFTCGRNLTNDEAKDVIENGGSTMKYKFHSSRTGKDYETFLKFDGQYIKPDFERK